MGAHICGFCNSEPCECTPIATMTVGQLRATVITYLQGMARTSRFTKAECQQFEDVANLLKRGPK